MVYLRYASSRRREETFRRYPYSNLETPMTQKIKKILNPDSRRTFFRRFFAGLLGTGVATAGIALAASEENIVTPSTPPVRHEPLLGEITMFGGNFAPRGWALCNGQLLPTSANTALFSILGTLYGGDGRSTFGMPDLSGRVEMHPGRGPRLTSRSMGDKGGSEGVPGVGVASGTDAHVPGNNMQPYQCVNFIIALDGIYPSRN